MADSLLAVATEVWYALLAVWGHWTRLFHLERVVSGSLPLVLASTGEDLWILEVSGGSELVYFAVGAVLVSLHRLLQDCS